MEVALQDASERAARRWDWSPSLTRGASSGGWGCGAFNRWSHPSPQKTQPAGAKNLPNSEDWRRRKLVWRRPLCAAVDAARGSLHSGRASTQQPPETARGSSGQWAAHVPKTQADGRRQRRRQQEAAGTSLQVRPRAAAAAAASRKGERRREKPSHRREQRAHHMMRRSARLSPSPFPSLALPRERRKATRGRHTCRRRTSTKPTTPLHSCRQAGRQAGGRGRGGKIESKGKERERPTSGAAPSLPPPLRLLPPQRQPGLPPPSSCTH